MDQVLDGDYVGKEISLGQLVQAQTGVCRHRSLLFKVLADEVGVPSALVRGNYIDSRGSGGHAWNEVKLENGQRIIVDVMHDFVGYMNHPKVQHYADVKNKKMYDPAGIAKIEAISAQELRASQPRQTPDLNKIEWFDVTNRQGEHAKYLDISDMNPSQVSQFKQSLAHHGIEFEVKNSSANGGMKVISVTGDDISRLRTADLNVFSLRVVACRLLRTRVRRKILQRK